MQPYILTYMHTLICTYIHTHTYIHTYMHTHIRTYMQPYILTYMHTLIRTYTHIYTFIHTFRRCISVSQRQQNVQYPINTQIYAIFTVKNTINTLQNNVMGIEYLKALLFSRKFVA
jgi:hypothetical protein